MGAVTPLLVNNTCHVRLLFLAAIHSVGGPGLWSCELGGVLQASVADTLSGQALDRRG